MKSIFEQAGDAISWRSLEQFGTRLIFLIRLIILIRLLSPEDFGLIAIATIAIDLLLSLTNLGMTQALIQLRVVDERHYNNAWTLEIIRGLSVTLVAFFSAPLVSHLFGEPGVEEIVRILALRPLMDAAASIKVVELTRNLNFRSISIIELLKSLANTIVAVVFAKEFGAWALVAGTLAGSATYMWLSYYLAPHRPQFIIDSITIRSLIRFGRWVFLISLIVMVGQFFLRMIISRQLGTEELGLYYLAASLAFLPLEMARLTVGEVAFPLYARIQTDVFQTAQAFRTILISLAVLLVPGIFLMIALTPSLIENVLGAKWEGTAPIIQILALSSLLGLLGETIVPIFYGSGRPDKVLVIEVVQTIVLISFVTLFINNFGVVGAALAWLPAIAASQGICILFIHKVLPKPFYGLALPLGVLTIISALATVFAIRVDRLLPGLFGLVSAAALGLFIVGVLIWILERRYRLGLSVGIVRGYPRLAAVVGLVPKEVSWPSHIG